MILANWYRSMDLIPAQKAIGVTTLIGYESGGLQPSTRDQWKAAASAAGLNYILQIPGDDATLIKEGQDASCLGFDLTDEPNAGQPSTTPVSVLAAQAARVRKLAPGKKILINFDGAQEEAWNPTFDYHAAAALADIVMFDYYVRNRSGPGPDIKATMTPILQRFKGYCQNGQMFGFFVETDAQLLNLQGWAPLSCAPSPADVQAYFDLAKQFNCDILSLFEDVIGTGWVSFGSTPQAVYDVIKSNMGGTVQPPQPIPAPVDLTPRVAALESEVAAIQAKLASLKGAL